MNNFDPSQLSVWTGGCWTAAPVSPLTGFTMDSRQLRPGQIFLALKTEKRDGHDFLPAAEAAGASAALVTQANPALSLPQLVVADVLAAFQAIARGHRRLFSGPVIGVTGSAGKTSTKNLLATLLGGEEGGVLATEGNLNNFLGVPLTLTRLDPAKHRFAVIEAGISEPGEMAVLASMIEPDFAITTLIAPAHLEELGGLDGVAFEKSRLSVAVREGGAAIFPGSCGRFTAFKQLTVEKIELGPGACVVEHRGGATHLVLTTAKSPALLFQLRRVSTGMAQNAALALAAALRLGIDPALLQQRLAAWAPSKWRGEVREENGRLLYIDCYNANPASMLDALDAFNGMTPPEQPRLYVLGGMEELGSGAEAYHRELGRSLRLRAGDRVFVIGAHAEAVSGGARQVGIEEEQIKVMTSLEPAREAMAHFQGTVFVKGSRRYQLEKLIEPGSPASTHA